MLGHTAHHIASIRYAVPIGVPPILTWDLTWMGRGGGTHCPDLAWPMMGYPHQEGGVPPDPSPVLTWDGGTPPPKCEQTENITFHHLSDAGDKKNCSKFGSNERGPKLSK